MYPYGDPRINPRDVVNLARAHDELRARYARLEQAWAAEHRERERLAAELATLERELRARPRPTVDADAVDELLRQAEGRAARVRELEAALAERDRRLEALTADLDAASARVRELEAADPPEAPSRDDGLEERYARLAADFQNQRRHRDDELARARRQERDRLLGELIGAVDLLEGALASNPDQESAWAQGHAAIVRQLQAALAREGVERVGAAGEPFDPRLHEALAAVDGGEPDTVHTVERPGYRYADGTLLRPARVLVGRG